MTRRSPSLRTLVLIASVLTLAVFAFACGETPAESAPQTAPQTTPQSTPEPFGIEFDKLSATIDGAIEGQDVTQTFLLINQGQQAAIVKSVSVLDASECDEVVVPDASFFVPPGDISVMSVLMKGHQASESPHTVSLGVQTQAGGDAQTTLAVNFQAVAPALEVQSGPRLGFDRQSIDIGVVAYNWPMHERVELFNYGDEPLRFDGMPLVRILEGC